MAKRKISLGTIADVRREMANVYRDAKAKKTDIGEAHKLTMILREIVKAVDIEKDKDEGKQNWTQNITIYGMNENAI